MKLINEFKGATTPGNIKKIYRRHNWVMWACNLLRRRKIAAWPDFCGMKRKHLVGPDIIKVGTGFAFKSLACSGCPHGIILLDKGQEENRKLVVKDNRTHCQYLAYYYIPFQDQVKPGDVVDTHPINAKTKPKIPKGELGTKIAHITK